VKVLPLVEEGGQVIRLRPHPRPPAKSIGLIADLEGEKLRADRARDVGSFSGRFLGRASRQIEPVDEPPPKRAQKTGEAIDSGWRDDETLAWRWGILRSPQRAFAGVAANPQYPFGP
jgi:hypothetical protein